MKIKVLKTTIFVVFAVMAMLGCKKQPVIYANHDITACGVDDPLVNLPWLAEICNNSMDEKDMSIYLKQDTITNDYYFVTLIAFELKGRGKFVEGDIFNCSGDKILSYTTITPPRPELCEFDENKINLGVIWSIKQ